MDAIQMLKDDHQKVKELFRAFEQQPAEPEKRHIVETVLRELDVHSQLEEEIFYPAVRQATEEHELMDEAVEEHHVVDQLMQELWRMKPGQERYDATRQNGVQTGASARHGGSFRFAAVSVTTPMRTSSLSSFRDLVGQSVTLPVVGAAASNVWGWGSQVYTDDSLLAAAVVHSGVLSVGEFGFVKITFLPGQSHYDGSVQNGLTSQSYDAWEGSFRVERAQEPFTVQLPGDEDASRLVPMATMRALTGASFLVQVVGSVNGAVWGTGAYTDDSSIAAAAVHAGLLKPGELGFLRVHLEAGRDRYVPSESHDIASLPFGPWEGSFRLERVAKP